MNKLRDQIIREAREEGRKEGREEAREYFKTVLLENGFSVEKANSLIEKLVSKEQAE